ncbi:MAG: bifunctional diguanylate cyclase/phosphodiesterase [Gammaproteobacteria bacterium]|nr:bifunctional diguanylate cyclase/phosphodiesterase [Gammaproteobacteria bacterium]
MNQRLKWLLIFSLVTTTVVVAFAYLSFDATRESGVEKQLTVLRGLLSNTLNDIDNTLTQNGDINELIERIEAKEPENIYFYVHSNEGTLTYVLSPSNEFPSLYSFIGDQRENGQQVINDKLYTWFNTPVSSANSYITAVYVEDAKEAYSFMKEMGVSLAFGTLMVVWLSAWLAMYVAGLLRKLGQQRDALTHQSMHDSLTLLPNRKLLLDHLDQAIAMGKRSDREHGVLLVDLNGFKDVNDALGHHYGDDLLKQISSVLTSVVRDSDTVARIDGDEFGILLYDTDDYGAEIVARKIIDKLEHELVVGKERFFISACIGIAMFPRDAKESVTLVHHADKALDHAKISGLNLSFYTDENVDEQTELMLVGELRDAIENDALTLVYQPKYDLLHRSVVSAEALVRWHHPSRGILPPMRFIPLAERTGLMGRLTMWVLWRAFRDFAYFYKRGHELHLSVNLSVQNLNDPRFVEQVIELVKRTNVNPRHFTLEVTESAIVHDTTRVSQVLTSLRDMGFRVSIDDFGTGYSSFVNFKKLPIDEIKIDRSFVYNAVNNQQDASIIEATVNVGRAFGYGIVAEGIENEATAGFLRRLGCHMGQGFFFAKPMEVEHFTNWLTQFQNEQNDLDAAS